MTDYPQTLILHPRMSDGSLPYGMFATTLDGVEILPGPKTVSITDPDAQITEILDHGTGLWGFADIRPVADAADLSRPADDQWRRVLTTRATFFGLTPEGLLTFGADQMLRWSDLERASDAGLIDGDIREMVVYVDRGTAGGGAHEVIELVRWAFQNREAIVFARDIAAMLAASAVSAASLRKPVLWLSDQRVKRLGREFRSRGYTTMTIMLWVERRPRWSATDLASRLGLEDEEARALLREMGWRPQEDGLFVRSFDDESVARRAIMYANGFQGPDVMEGDPIPVESRWTWWDEAERQGEVPEGER